MCFKRKYKVFTIQRYLEVGGTKETGCASIKSDINYQVMISTVFKFEAYPVCVLSTLLL